MTAWIQSGVVFRDWSDPEVARLTHLWPSHSASLSAGMMGTRPRGAIIGKANRLGLKKGPDAPRQQRQTPPAKPVLRLVPQAPRKPVVEEILGPARACQWPHGNPGERDFHFCGEPSLPGKSYCGPHCAIAYVPKVNMRREYG